MAGRAHEDEAQGAHEEQGGETTARPVGAACGQGAAEAEALAGEGAHVVATDVTEAPRCRRPDVSGEREWAELAADLRESYGRVHGPVNNAGITWRARLGEVRPEDMAWVHALDVTGPLLGIQHLALPKAAALELGPHGILVSTIRPGYIETGMTASAAAAFREANIRGTPLGRTGAVEEVAPLVVFLLTRTAGGISMTVSEHGYR